MRGACALDVMIPTGTSGEWTAFRGNSPACVTFQDCNPTEVCCNPDGTIMSAGTLVSYGSYSCVAGGNPNCCRECRYNTYCSGSAGDSTYTGSADCRNINQGQVCQPRGAWVYSLCNDGGANRCCSRWRNNARTCSSGSCPFAGSQTTHASSGYYYDSGTGAHTSGEMGHLCTQQYCAGNAWQCCKCECDGGESSVTCTCGLFGRCCSCIGGCDSCRSDSLCWKAASPSGGCTW